MRSGRAGRRRSPGSVTFPREAARLWRDPPRGHGGGTQTTNSPSAENGACLEPAGAVHYGDRRSDGACSARSRLSFVRSSEKNVMTAPAGWWRPGLAGLGVLGLVAAAWWWPGHGFTPRPTPVAKFLLPQPVALAPGVYLLGKLAPGAAYAVETPEGLVLIDSGLQADAAAVTEQLAALGLDVGRLRAVLLTHVHADHSLGAEHLRARTGAKVYAGRADCPPLREGGPREAFFSSFHMPDVAAHPTTVDVELVGGETLAFGSTRFAVIAAPGHTPGSVCYLLERPGLRALFTGDVVLHLSPAGGDALGTYAAYLPPLYRGSARDYLATLRKLRALPLPDLILPGHPRMDPEPQRPHLTAERWQALLDRGIADMEQLLARYEADGPNFLDGHPKELLPGLHYLGDFGGSAVYALATPKGLFLFDAPGGPLLVDFLAKRFQKLGWEGHKPTAVFLTSADEEASAGLAALVEQSGCAVVVSKAGVDEVRRHCPAETRILTEEEVEKAGWFDVRAVGLSGRGLAPAAYQVRWTGKTVLVSGRIPVRLSTPSAEQLIRDVTGPRGNIGQYLKALGQLAEVKPDLWLPAVPVHGQNANLYDRDWERVLSQNRQVFP
jgi:glyoxylase-like metal-dependent hydrolase (beta-lactamase superfamily II)